MQCWGFEKTAKAWMLDSCSVTKWIANANSLNERAAIWERALFPDESRPSDPDSATHGGISDQLVHSLLREVLNQRQVRRSEAKAAHPRHITFLRPRTFPITWPLPHWDFQICTSPFGRIGGDVFVVDSLSWFICFIFGNLQRLLMQNAKFVDASQSFSTCHSRLPPFLSTDQKNMITSGPKYLDNRSGPPE